MTAATEPKRKGSLRNPRAEAEREPEKRSSPKTSVASRVHNDPLTAGRALADVAVKIHAPEMLARCGAVGRAKASMRRGSTPAAAAALAAKQGKGALAELRVATSFTVDSGLKGRAVACAINPVQNHPQADLHVIAGAKRLATVQVGVGTAGYASTKIRESRADHIVVGTESIQALRHADAKLPPHAGDRLVADGVSSDPISARGCDQDARESILATIGVPHQALAPCAVRNSLRAGARSAWIAGLSSLAFGAAERIGRGDGLDWKLVEQPIKDAWDAFLASALQTFLVTRAYIAHASTALEFGLLHSLSKSVAWAGAAAEFLISFGKEIIAWLSGQIDFASFIARMLVRASEVLGAALLTLIALQTTDGLHPLLRALVLIGAAWLGSELGRSVGQAVVSPKAARPTSGSPALALAV